MGSSVRFESVGSTATLISMLEKSVVRLVDISRKRRMRTVRGGPARSAIPVPSPRNFYQGVITHGRSGDDLTRTFYTFYY